MASIRTLRRYLLVDGVRYVRRSFPREALQKLAAREKWARAMTYAGGKWYGGCKVIHRPNLASRQPRVTFLPALKSQENDIQ